MSENIYNSINEFRGLANCYVANCNYCASKDQCDQCKPGYELLNSKCYNTQCQIFQRCKYCTELDCVHCEKGYRVSYGFCEIDETLFKLHIFLGVILPIFIITIIIISCILYFKRRNKKISQKVISADIVGQRKTTSGQYIIINTTNITNSGTISFNDEKSVSSSPIGIISKIKKNVISSKFKGNNNNSNNNNKHCILCEKSIFSFSTCGCGLCKEHSIEKDKKCPIHNCLLEDNLVIKKEKKKKLEKKNSNNSDDDCKMCHFCKIKKGTVSFNCGCPVLLCTKCFNDNVYVFKFNRCPGCNKPINSNS